MCLFFFIIIIYFFLKTAIPSAGLILKKSHKKNVAIRSTEWRTPLVWCQSPTHKVLQGSGKTDSARQARKKVQAPCEGFLKDQFLHVVFNIFFVLVDASYFWDLLKVTVMTFIPVHIGINNYKLFDQVNWHGSKEIGQSCCREMHGKLHSTKWWSIARIITNHSMTWPGKLKECIPCISSYSEIYLPLSSFHDNS